MISLSNLFNGPYTEIPRVPLVTALAELGEHTSRFTHCRLGRSLAIRAVDAGSCNGCELELHALNNVFYDIEHVGFNFVASPRHADVLLITGPVTCNMKEALIRTWQSIPNPKWVIAVGDCACGNSVFADSYAIAGQVDDFLPVTLHLPGCPPTPHYLLEGLLALLKMIA